MTQTLAALLGLQGLLILVDEVHFHRKRGLGKWERWGHPIDALVTAAVFLVLWLFRPHEASEFSIIGLMVFSCVLVTKDEWIHAKECNGSEQWLHAGLFLIHPAVFIASYQLWALGEKDSWIFLIAATAAGATAIHQLIYWNLLKRVIR